MPVLVAVAVTWVGLMSLLVARARRHRRPGEPHATAVQPPEGPSAGA